MDTGTNERGAVAGPRRAAHGAAVVDRSLVECSKRATMRSKMKGQRGLVPVAMGGMVLACFPVRLGARRRTQARILPAAIFRATVRADCCLPPPFTCCPRCFLTAPRDRLSGLKIARLPCMGPAPASSCTTSGARFPLGFPLHLRGQKVKGGVVWVTRRRPALQG